MVKRLLEDGENGLEDRRGKAKLDEDLNELELLRRENKRLERKLEKER